MKIATWNVNSLNARLGRVESWVAQHQPDVLCLQETKCTDDAFPAATFAAHGYQSAHHGDGRWNGVAIISRVGLDDVRAGFTPKSDEADECRLLAATCAGIRVFSAYVPNGRAVDSEHFVAKLSWMRRLAKELADNYDPSSPLVVCGDFNIAPEDRDVWDIAAFEGATHVTSDERAVLGEVTAFGLTDALRTLHPDVVGPFSWWDYRAGAFHKGWGMRIDLALVSEPLAKTLTSAHIDREARKKGSGEVTTPSDHAPVVIELDYGD